MEFSNPCSTIMKKFAECRQLVVAPSKNKQNSHLKNHYADLNSVYLAIGQAMIKTGLTLIQEPVYREGVARDVLLIQTTILHAESCEYMTSTLQIPLSKNDPQGFGSALTYGKRYAAVSIFCLDSADDDANRSIKTQKIWQRDINGAQSMEDLKAISKELAATNDQAMIKVVSEMLTIRRGEIEVENSQSFTAPVKQKEKISNEKQPQAPQKEEDF